MNIRIVAAVAVLAIAACPPASAGEYTVFVDEAQADLDLRDRDTTESVDDCAAFPQFAGLPQSSGMMRGGAPLKDPASAHTIRAGAPAIARGGAVEARETYSAPTMMQ